MTVDMLLASFALAVKGGVTIVTVKDTLYPGR